MTRNEQLLQIATCLRENHLLDIEQSWMRINDTFNSRGLIAHSIDKNGWNKTGCPETPWYNFYILIFAKNHKGVMFITDKDIDKITLMLDEGWLPCILADWIEDNMIS
jgi:hypothetical protein